MKISQLLVLVCLFLFCSCRVSHQYSKFDFNNGPNPCINAFKDRVFLSILTEAYKGTDALKEISKKDVGNPYDGIYSPELFKKIDSIGHDFFKKIPPPELCECGKGQNYFMAQALHFYASRELDSVAKIELKNFSINCFKK
ncbi:hypothetical protein [Pedobacter agri]|uniref:hypothetical protein n=1 Tax=Pedobacter agri TaxID=454586 RepID=UPI0029303550|nr:hypothetical protein [Pedobacter agri]